ncbi:hypothetical protein PC123_g11411 [Phytophthora cactorum]|nr:hypothetical protein PC123_g11411 [Phytophthora cactorum]
MRVPPQSLQSFRSFVALSRVASRSKFKALIEYPQLEEEDGVYTDNIVYMQIFE